MDESQPNVLETSLTQLGLDSLIIIEIQHILESDTGVSISLAEIRQITLKKIEQITSSVTT